MNSFPSGIRLFAKTRDHVQETWERIKNFDILFTDDARWDEEQFFSRIFSEDTLVLENEHLLVLVTDIHQNFYASCHIVSFDHKLSAHTPLFRDCLRWVMDYYNLQRFEALIPERSKALAHFLRENMGFKLEGILRKRVIYKGMFENILIFAVLREEVL